MWTKIYTLSDFFYVVYCYIRSRMSYPSTRIIRYPIDVRGRKYIDLGENLTIGKGCRFEVYPHLMKPNEEKKLIFGHDVIINDYVHITALGSVKIGDNVLMASHIYISDCQHGYYQGEKSSDPETPPIKREYLIENVSIEDNVWIGEYVSILPGVTIGKGSVIGANSVVTKSIPPYSIAVGSPAKVIKKYDFKTKVWIKAL